MSVSNNIYAHLPVFVQNLAISFYGFMWKRRRFGGIFKSELSNAMEREKFTKKEWEQYKQSRFSEIVNHAFTTIPFYINKKTELGLTNDLITNISVSDISKLPFLEKDDLRKFGTSDLLCKQLPGNGEYFSSSGSTGTPTKIFYSAKMHQQWNAIFMARVRQWAGINQHMARGMIGGRRVVTNANAAPPYYRYNIFEKQVYFSAYHLSPASISDYVQGMKKFKIEYMTGYAVSIYLLALYIKQQKINAPDLKAVITSSEKLTHEMRRVMMEVFNCKVYDGWSGVEACALVSECEYGSLHISEDAGLLEILDENGKEVLAGETGEVVCTGFLNYHQPFIRYKIGDRMKKSEIQSCECGRHMPVIDEIEGRSEDVVTGPDGRQMVRFHGIFIDIGKIERAQVIQHALSEIELLIQTAEKLTLAEIKMLKQRLISQLGEVNIVITEVLKIPQTPNGKYKAVISHLK